MVADADATAAEALPRLIKQCLQDANCRWPDIGRLAATTGPGSFTSIRAGLATVKGLALARGLKVLPMTAFDCLAWFYDAPITVVVAAGRGQRYFQHFDANHDQASDPLLIEGGKMLFDAARVVVASGGIADDLRMHQTDNEFIVSEPINAGMVAIGASRMLAAGVPCLSGHRLLPFYLRPPDARKAAGKSLIDNRVGR